MRRAALLSHVVTAVCMHSEESAPFCFFLLLLVTLLLMFEASMIPHKAFISNTRGYVCFAHILFVASVDLLGRTVSYEICGKVAD